MTRFSLVLHRDGEPDLEVPFALPEGWWKLSPDLVVVRWLRPAWQVLAQRAATEQFVAPAVRAYNQAANDTITAWLTGTQDVHAECPFCGRLEQDGHQSSCPVIHARRGTQDAEDA